MSSQARASGVKTNWATVDARDKFEDGIENFGDEIFFFGEEEHVAHDRARGVDFGDGRDAIFGALDEEIEGFERGGGIGADASEFAGEGCAEGDVVFVVFCADAADVGDFVGEDGRVGGSEARDCGFAGAGNSGEEECALVANCAGSVEKEAAFFGEDERMGDAEDGVDRVGIRALGDAAVAGARVPGGVEIAAAEIPERAFARDAGVFVGSAAAWVEMDFEAAGDVGMLRALRVAKVS